MKPIVIDTTQIRDRAYSRWQEQGCPEGTAERDWLYAEQEIAAQCADPAPSAAPGKPPSSAPTPRAAAAASPSKEAAQRVKPPRPKLERAPSTRGAKVSNDVAAKGPAESRTQRTLAAAAAAHIKRSAIGSS
jgi:hypothetical protein